MAIRRALSKLQGQHRRASSCHHHHRRHLSISRSTQHASPALASILLSPPSSWNNLNPTSLGSFPIIYVLPRFPFPSSQTQLLQLHHGTAALANSARISRSFTLQPGTSDFTHIGDDPLPPVPSGDFEALRISLPANLWSPSKLHLVIHIQSRRVVNFTPHPTYADKRSRESYPLWPPFSEMNNPTLLV